MKVRSLNIALLHYSCPPVVGGVEEVIRQQALLFRRYFNHVKVFAGSGSQFGECPVEINPILGSRNRKVLKAHRLAIEGRYDALHHLSKEIHCYLKRELAGFDLTIAHNVMTMPYNLPLTMALAWLAEEEGLRVVSWNHDSPYFYEGHPPHLHRPPWDILKRTVPNVEYVVISESRKAQFSRLYGTGKHLTVIPNGIDPIEFFHLDPVTMRLIGEERLFERELVLVQPCRLHPRKNIETSIRVVHALKGMGLDVVLLVTGPHDPHREKDVEYHGMLRSLIRGLKVDKEVLILADYTFRSGERLLPDRITTRDLYLIADALFFPSHQEGFGIPLLEAGMIKLPVVCSNIPPHREIGERDVCYFEPGDPPEAIARRMVDFLRGLRPHRLFRRTMRDYVWDNIYHSRLLPFLHSLVRE